MADETRGGGDACREKTFHREKKDAVFHADRRSKERAISSNQEGEEGTHRSELEKRPCARGWCAIRGLQKGGDRVWDSSRGVDEERVYFTFSENLDSQERAFSGKTKREQLWVLLHGQKWFGGLYRQYRVGGLASHVSGREVLEESPRGSYWGIHCKIRHGPPWDSEGGGGHNTGEAADKSQKVPRGRGGKLTPESTAFFE